MKCRWLLLLLLILIPFANAADDDQTLQVELFEEGKITNYLNTYWVVQVNGSGSIYNPSDLDLFDVRLYFDILNLDLIPGDGDGSFDANSVFFDRIPSQQYNYFSYTIVGITTEPPTLSGKGVLYTGFSKRTTRIYSDVFGEIQKAPLEDPSVTNRDARLVSVTLNNPTQFQFTIDSLRVIKSSDLNPNNVIDSWEIVKESTPRILDPDGFFVHDILDVNATEGQVYWLDTEVYISKVDLIDNNTVIRYTEKNLTVPVEDLNFTNETDNQTRLYIEDGFALQKRISDSIAVPDQPLEVTLILFNFGDTLKKFTLEDDLPAGFFASQDLEWSGESPARNSVVFRYDVVLNDTVSAGFDVFPSATAYIDNKVIRSREVPFVRQFVPDDRVYVQKRVAYRDDDKVSVEISVENLGKNPLSGAHLKEFLEDDDLFSEITEVPESKGLWVVPLIAPGEEWVVSYVTEPGNSLTRLPTIYGAPNHSVLRSIILENVVNEAWEFVRTNFVEITGLLVVILVPVLLWVSKKLNWF